MKHSPEPWTTKTGQGDAVSVIVDSQGESVFGVVSTGYDEAGYVDVSDADESRIIACVNALAGIPDDRIPVIAEIVRMANEPPEST